MSFNWHALADSQLPVLKNVNQYQCSAGPECIRLAESAGLILDPWQQGLVIDTLAEDPDGLWKFLEIAVILGRQNGKGSFLEAIALGKMVLFGSKLLIWTAHEMKTASEAFLRMEALFDGSTELRKLIARNGVLRGNGKEGITLRNGSRLRFLARSSGSGRGFSGDDVILDEAYALTSEHVSALMPTLSARPNPQVFYTSSPPLTPETGEPLYRLRERALAGDPGLMYADWGVQGVDLTTAFEKNPETKLARVDLDDRRLWRRHNPAFGYRLTEAFTAKERRSMKPEDFARERLGIWPPRAEGDSPIDAKLWAELVDREAEIVGPLVFAADVTPDRRYASIVSYGRAVVFVDGEPVDIGVTEVVDSRPGTEWVVGRLVELKETWNPLAFTLDLRSPAGSLILDLAEVGIKVPENPNEPKWGDLAIPTTQEVGAACGQLLDAVNQRALRHRDQLPLNLAVGGAKTRPVGDTWAWGRRVSEIDISPLCAATFGRWAYQARESVAEDYDILASVY